MGKSAKLTRGGNKKRVNVGRQEAKAKAHQLAAAHNTAKDAHKARPTAPKAAHEKRVAIIKKAVKKQTIVKMAAKPQPAPQADS
jgi:hypothetical protein